MHEFQSGKELLQWKCCKLLVGLLIRCESHAIFTDFWLYTYLESAYEIIST